MKNDMRNSCVWIIMSKAIPTWFRLWRKGLKLTQKEAALLLGIKPRMLQNYESGSHDIPLYIRLAMASLSQGVVDYGDGLLFRPDQPLPLYAADKLAKAKAADKEQSKKERRETRGS
ncbi:MAG: helix-turn-helix transcriptional regulator [Alphaproteobacteria bacterium]